MTEYFPYGEKEIAWLKSRDARLGEAIDRIGALIRDGQLPNLALLDLSCGLSESL